MTPRSYWLCQRLGWGLYALVEAGPLGRLDVLLRGGPEVELSRRQTVARNSW